MTILPGQMLLAVLFLSLSLNTTLYTTVDVPGGLLFLTGFSYLVLLSMTF